MKLPDSFVADMQQLLPDEFDTYLASYDEPRWYGLRVNTNKISVEEFLKISPFALTPIPWIENGFYYNGEEEKPGKHPYYYAGLYYLQEPSAMTPANRLPIKAGERVLDLCAAPGGKTTELGAKLAGTGLLVSNDISNSRARILLKNQEVFGLGNICVMSEDPKKMVENFQGYFDKILIDAPCSGEGMFRKNTQMIKSWEEEGPDYYTGIQKTLILQAAEMLKPGGMMLYSTCTFNQEENEGTITHLLEQKPEFTAVEMEGYEGFRSGYAPISESVRIWPHHMKGEGHYLALVHKSIETDHIPQGKAKGSKSKSVTIPEDLKEFWQNVTWKLPSKQLLVLGEKIYYCPFEMPDVTKLRMLRNGVLLGECKKNRFEPSQALAMYLQREDYTQVLDLTCEDIRVRKYLKGETLDVEDLVTRKDKGWYLICVDGYPLGFGKVANQMLKNKYATGWRMQS